MYEQLSFGLSDLEDEKHKSYESIAEAEKVAIERIKVASEMSHYYYHKPLIITYSGGKDSDVMLHIAEKAGVPMVVQYSVTTVDAPQTTRHVNEVFARLESKGITTERHIPMYKGEKTNMWKLIPQKLMPPTRIVRYCCDVLKEQSTPNRLICTGVRWDESKARTSRSVFEVRGVNKKSALNFTLQHTKDVFYESKALDEGNAPNDLDCKLIENAKKNNNIICNPIIDWTNNMVWEYIHSENIPYNDLYKPPFNYKRVGCIGCPMANNKKELEDFPHIKERYIKAFDELVKVRKESGREDGFQTGQEWFDWWISK